MLPTVVVGGVGYWFLVVLLVFRFVLFCLFSLIIVLVYVSVVVGWFVLLILGVVCVCVLVDLVVRIADCCYGFSGCGFVLWHGACGCGINSVALTCFFCFVYCVVLLI